MVFLWIVIFPFKSQAQSNQGLISQLVVLEHPPYLIPFPAGYPEVPKEGADSLEILRYKQLKEKWILENPELYHKISERPSIYTQAEQDSIRGRKEEEMRVSIPLYRVR
jgi:hypothetical protein